MAVPCCLNGSKSDQLQASCLHWPLTGSPSHRFRRRMRGVCRQLEAMAVAHLPALHVLAGAVDTADLCRVSVTHGLSWAAVTGPTALATLPTLLTLFQQLLEVGQGCTPGWLHAGLASSTVCAGCTCLTQPGSD